MNFPPLKFEPIFKHRIWGSDRLKKLYNKNLPNAEPIGESWELADLKNDKSIIADGPYKGMDIRQLLRDHGKNIGFTTEQCQFPFGLLIKFLDANDILSVQVHPDAQACQKFPDAHLKTECWYVLDAKPNSVIYRGLKPGVGRKDLEKALQNNILEDLMEVYPAEKGDFHYLPAGTIHALGAGVIVAEIQTPSDTTYRLYDWNRRDAQGNSRQLHIEQALESIHYTDSSATPPAGDHKKIILGADEKQNPLKNIADSLGRSKTLLDCDHFSVVHLKLSEDGVRMFSAGIPFVMIALSGSGSIVNEDDPENICTYQTGDTILIPTMPAGRIKVKQPGQNLLTSLATP
ncbi:MAG: class I mannose-6-phosphate isomerase [Sedimentisphaerales bacterium]|nr:class I mannose-6-phosphate isomerase [Sedimentisphaerales bacterium]